MRVRWGEMQRNRRESERQNSPEQQLVWRGGGSTGTFQGQDLVRLWEQTTPPSAVILARKEGSTSPRLPAESLLF